MNKCKSIIQNSLFISWFVIFCLILVHIQLFSQPNKRTNQWFFARNVGVDFNSGEPVEGYPCPIDGTSSGSTSTMCDTNGSLLFYSDGRYVYNKNHEQMENSWAGPDYVHGSQSALCMPKPGSDSLYYVFTANTFTQQYNQPLNFYHTVDMTLNDGLGGILDTDTLPGAWDASEQLNASYFKDKSGYWIVMRKYKEHKYAAYKVTSQGVDPNSVLRDAPNRYLPNANYGYMKFTYDKKYLLFFYNYGTGYFQDIEICKFNNNTGEIEFLYSFQLIELFPNNPPPYQTMNGEFSPDSKYMYVAGYLKAADSTHIYQFDMQYIEDKDLLKQSAVKIGEGIGMNLQLASNGRIYCFSNDVPGPVDNTVSVINNPGKPGIQCNYQENILFINNGDVVRAFVNFATDFLFRFDFDGICESDTFSFDPWFFPEPVSIQWNFGDPMSGTNNTSFDSHPTHKFTDGGTYEVSVYVVYPSGRIEETSREVEVEYSPEPDLGPDTTICYSQDIVLDAECGSHFYLWSTGQFGISQIIVSDTGWYWVKVTSDAGCFKYDSIHIGKYTAAIADTANLIISPTTCGGSTGAIRELVVIGIPPYSYQWVDDLGNPIANTLDLYNLPVGNYTLHVTDGNNCTTEFGPFSIIDAGDVLVASVNYTNEHCDQQDGSLIVTATSGLGDMLYYSIDNGTSYIQNLGVFTGLSSGTYAVRVHDSTMCEDAYDDNPIIIVNTQVPQITDIQITSATVGQNNGAINIVASGSSDTLLYSNNDGVTFQINDGFFSNLLADFYTCVVVDEFGCDTTFIIEVTEDFIVSLKAVAGDDEVCPGISAYVPLTVTNFNDVASFKTSLLFDDEYLTCMGFANAHPLLEDSLEAFLFPAEGRIELNWSSTAIDLSENTVLADLAFQTANPGGSLIEWDGSPGASIFLNSTGLTIPVDYMVGEVRIYDEVYFTLASIAEACQGETIMLYPNLWSSNGPVTYLWSYPNGDTSSAATMVINNAKLTQSGTYSVAVTDTANCSSDAIVDVFIYPTPSPEFAVQDTIFTDDPFDLDAGTGFISYFWNNGDTTQMIWVEEKGWYSAEVESPEGCVGVDSSYVVFSTPPELIKIYFPNAFTPNGDGLNDEFKPVTVTDEIKHFSLSIFNRWGAMIYQSNDITQGWDGTYNGEICQPGSYVYKIAYSTFVPSTAESEIKMGTVMLVR